MQQLSQDSAARQISRPAANDPSNVTAHDHDSRFEQLAPRQFPSPATVVTQLLSTSPQSAHATSSTSRAPSSTVCGSSHASLSLNEPRAMKQMLSAPARTQESTPLPSASSNHELPADGMNVPAASLPLYAQPYGSGTSGDQQRHAPVLSASDHAADLRTTPMLDNDSGSGEPLSRVQQVQRLLAQHRAATQQPHQQSRSEMPTTFHNNDESKPAALSASSSSSAAAAGSALLDEKPIGAHAHAYATPTTTIPQSRRAPSPAVHGPQQKALLRQNSPAPTSSVIPTPGRPVGLGLSFASNATTPDLAVFPVTGHIPIGVRQHSPHQPPFARPYSPHGSPMSRAQSPHGHNMARPSSPRRQYGIMSGSTHDSPDGSFMPPYSNRGQRQQSPRGEARADSPIYTPPGLGAKRKVNTNLRVDTAISSPQKLPQLQQQQQQQEKRRQPLLQTAKDRVDQPRSVQHSVQHPSQQPAQRPAQHSSQAAQHPAQHQPGTRHPRPPATQKKAIRKSTLQKPLPAPPRTSTLMLPTLAVDISDTSQDSSQQESPVSERSTSSPVSPISPMSLHKPHLNNDAENADAQSTASMGSPVSAMVSIDPDVPPQIPLDAPSVPVIPKSRIARKPVPRVTHASVEAARPSTPLTPPSSKFQVKINSSPAQATSRDATASQQTPSSISPVSPLVESPSDPQARSGEELEEERPTTSTTQDVESPVSAQPESPIRVEKARSIAIQPLEKHIVEPGVQSHRKAPSIALAPSLITLSEQPLVESSSSRRLATLASFPALPSPPLVREPTSAISGHSAAPSFTSVPSLFTLPETQEQSEDKADNIKDTPRRDSDAIGRSTPVVITKQPTLAEIEKELKKGDLSQSDILPKSVPWKSETSESPTQSLSSSTLQVPPAAAAQASTLDVEKAEAKPLEKSTPNRQTDITSRARQIPVNVPLHSGFGTSMFPLLSNPSRPKQDASSESRAPPKANILLDQSNTDQIPSYKSFFMQRKDSSAQALIPDFSILKLASIQKAPAAKEQEAAKPAEVLSTVPESEKYTKSRSVDTIPSSRAVVDEESAVRSTPQAVASKVSTTETVTTKPARSPEEIVTTEPVINSSTEKEKDVVIPQSASLRADEAALVVDPTRAKINKEAVVAESTPSKSVQDEVVKQKRISDQETDACATGPYSSARSSPGTTAHTASYSDITTQRVAPKTPEAKVAKIPTPTASYSPFPPQQPVRQLVSDPVAVEATSRGNPAHMQAISSRVQRSTSPVKQESPQKSIEAVASSISRQVMQHPMVAHHQNPSSTEGLSQHAKTIPEPTDVANTARTTKTRPESAIPPPVPRKDTIKAGVRKIFNPRSQPLPNKSNTDARPETPIYPQTKTTSAKEEGAELRESTQSSRTSAESLVSSNAELARKLSERSVEATSIDAIRARVAGTSRRTAKAVEPPAKDQKALLATLEDLSAQSEALHERYASIRVERQKLSSSLTVQLKENKTGPEYVSSLLDQHMALAAVTSSMDICFAKLKSLDCRKEEAISALIAQVNRKPSLTNVRDKQQPTAASKTPEVYQERPQVSTPTVVSKVSPSLVLPRVETTTVTRGAVNAVSLAVSTEPGTTATSRKQSTSSTLSTPRADQHPFQIGADITHGQPIELQITEAAEIAAVKNNGVTITQAIAGKLDPVENASRLVVTIGAMKTAKTPPPQRPLPAPPAKRKSPVDSLHPSPEDHDLQTSHEAEREEGMQTGFKKIPGKNIRVYADDDFLDYYRNAP